MDPFTILDDDAFRLVLERLPSQDLLSVRQVCRRWQSVSEPIFRSKHSLSLFCSPKIAKQYHQLFSNDNNTNNDLILGSGDDLPDPSVFTDLPSLFPSLHQLIVFHSQIDLPFMLDSWTELTSLSLMLSHQNDLFPLICIRLDKMSSLKKLCLFSISYTLPDEMSFLSQLEHFTLINYHANLTQVLKQLGPNCTHLHLENVMSAIWEMDELQQENPGLACSVTHLTLGHIAQSYCSFVDDTKNNLKRISHYFCEHFTKLKFLDVRFTFEKLPFSEFLPDLRLLPNLTELRLALKNADQLQQVETDLQVESAKVLHLNFGIDCEEASLPKDEFIRTIFPNVTRVHMKRTFNPILVYDLADSLMPNGD